MFLSLCPVPSANLLLNVACHHVPGLDTTAVAANCREAAEQSCRWCLKKIQSKMRQCQSISATSFRLIAMLQTLIN